MEIFVEAPHFNKIVLLCPKLEPMCYLVAFFGDLTK